MREILFRGKLKCNGDWSYGNLIIKPNIISLITPDDTPLGKYGEIDPKTVGQYTGLTDRNGKKIFEGDIVKYAGKIHQVVFEHKNGSAYFGIEISKIETWGFCHSVPADKMEVIGNIHDNPELIKVVGNIYDARGNKFN